MIHTARPAIPQEVRDALELLSSKTHDTEIDRARAYYHRSPRPTKAYGFERYKDWAVCKALDQLFLDKCAYCESSYQAVEARNVEHFRPKGRIRESPSHPGYWWLAASWENLLPSCIPCNQLRRQLAFEAGMTLEEFEQARLRRPEGSSGKGDSFPVRGDHWITGEDSDTANEDPFLINPTDPSRRPESHLEWAFSWDRPKYIWESTDVIAVLRPRQHDGTDDVYGTASIAVYGLNRSGLIRARMGHIRIMQQVCPPIVALIAKLAVTKDPEAEFELKAELSTRRRALTFFTTADQVYSAMAHAFVEEFDTELGRFAAAARS